jgi:chromate transporter
VALDVNRTVGGGYASMELLRRRFTAHGWLDAASHALLLAASRFTPGTNILAYCALLGWRSHRTTGALAALSAASVPSSIVIAALAATLVRVDQYRAVQVVLAIGILVASVLVLSSAWTLLRPYLKAVFWRETLIVAIVSIASIALGATPVRTLLVAAVAGLLLPVREPAKGLRP